MESQRFVCPGAGTPAAHKVDATLEVRRNDAILTIKYCNDKHTIQIHKIDSKTATCSVDGKPAQTIRFEGEDQFAIALGKELDKQLLGGRPNLRFCAGQIYEKLNFEMVARPQTEPERQPRRQPALRPNVRTINFMANGKQHSLDIEKISKDEIKYTIDGEKTGRIEFGSVGELRIELGKILDREYGPTRQKFPTEVDRVAKELGLIGKNIRSEDLQAVSGTRTVLDAEIGVYTIDDRPIKTNLLVEYERNEAKRCLSLVQNVFDLVYGVGEGKRAGLYSAYYAEELNFNGKPVFVENYDPKRHNNLDRGVIIRLSNTGASLRSIGISLGGGRVAHLIRGKLHIEKMEEELEDGWEPEQIIFPNGSFKQKPVELVTGEELTFKKDDSLEVIAPKLQKSLYALREKQLGAIQEIIYQYNQDKFEKKGKGIQLGMRLKQDSKIAIPKEWAGGESDPRMASGSR